MPRRSTATRPPRFLLDENLSYRVGRALILCEYEVKHVVLEDQELGEGTPDERIVPWCGENGRVWVTTDDDPRARHMRFALLPEYQVHAIILDPQPKGLDGQLGRIVRFYPAWVRHFEQMSPGTSNVWIQHQKGPLRRLWKRPS